MNIKEILQRKSELESLINVIDNHMTRVEAGGAVIVSVDGFHSVRINASEVGTILNGKRALYLQELGKINQAIDAMERMAESMLSDELP